jgi:hypothetical protein
MNVKYRYDIPSIETVEDAPIPPTSQWQAARALPSQGLAWTALPEPALSAKPGWRFDGFATICSVLRS